MITIFCFNCENAWFEFDYNISKCIFCDNIDIKMKEYKKYQVVNYFPKWLGFKFIRLDIHKTNMAMIYDWYLNLGFINIRKWNRNTIIKLDKNND